MATCDIESAVPWFNPVHIEPYKGNPKTANVFQDLISAISKRKHLFISFKVDEHRIFVHLADSDGLTLLHHAARCGDIDLVELFLILGKDATRKDNRGRTPMDLAEMNGHRLVAAFLSHKQTNLDCACEVCKRPDHKCLSRECFGGYCH